jgi:hypothetical protein
LNHSANISATALAKILRYEKEMSLQRVAFELNSAQLFTRNGKLQTACSVRNLLLRAELIKWTWFEFRYEKENINNAPIRKNSPSFLGVGSKQIIQWRDWVYKNGNGGDNGLREW